MSHDDEYMRIAIGEAQKAYACGERIAFGALIVRDDKIIAQAHNSVKDLYDPTAHAEIIAIRGAAQKLKTSDLEECVLYSTCEPCPMCFSAAWWEDSDVSLWHGLKGRAKWGTTRDRSPLFVSQR